jgi:hypothetical protein
MDIGIEPAAACRSLGLSWRCDQTHLVPRFQLEMTAPDGDAGPELLLSLNRNGGGEPQVVDLRRDPPGLLLAVVEDGVRREPVLNLWLPQRRRHLFLVHRPDGAWRLQALPAEADPATIDAALDLLS